MRGKHFSQLLLLFGIISSKYLALRPCVCVWARALLKIITDGSRWPSCRHRASPETSGIFTLHKCVSTTFWNIRKPIWFVTTRCIQRWTRKIQQKRKHEQKGPNVPFYVTVHPINTLAFTHSHWCRSHTCCPKRINNMHGSVVADITALAAGRTSNALCEPTALQTALSRNRVCAREWLWCSMGLWMSLLILSFHYVLNSHFKCGSLCCVACRALKGNKEWTRPKCIGNE